MKMSKMWSLPLLKLRIYGPSIKRFLISWSRVGLNPQHGHAHISVHLEYLLFAFLFQEFKEDTM